MTLILENSQISQRQAKDLENRLISVVNDIDRRLSALEDRVSKIPDPFVLYYRPPGEDYKKINEVLDDVHGRLNILEMVLGD